MVENKSGKVYVCDKIRGYINQQQHDLLRPEFAKNHCRVVIRSKSPRQRKSSG